MEAGVREGKIKAYLSFFTIDIHSSIIPEAFYVLSAFRHLHRTREIVFRGDRQALEAGRAKINCEFKKNKDVTEPSQIEELIVLAEESAKVLRTEVVQGRRVADDKYEVVITKDTALGENTIFKKDAILPTRKGRKKCSEETKSS